MQRKSGLTNFAKNKKIFTYFILKKEKVALMQAYFLFLIVLESKN